MNNFFKYIMKKILTAVLICLFLLPVVASAKILTYSNLQNSYSFIIPNGWVEIPKTTIDRVIHQAADQSGVQFIDYSAGFQLDGVPDFQYPYILVMEYKINTPSYNQITNILESYDYSKISDKITSKYSEFIANASVQNPFIDKERNIIFINTDAGVINFGKVKGLSAMFLGKESITLLIFYSPESEYSENLSTFTQIIDSFKYEQGYEYSKEEAKKNDPRSIFKGSVDSFITGFITVALVVLVYGLFYILKKKKV